MYNGNVWEGNVKEGNSLLHWESVETNSHCCFVLTTNYPK